MHRALVVSLAWLAAAASGPDRFVDPLDLPASPSPLADDRLLTSVAAAGRRLVAVGQRGHVVLSDDGGSTWVQAPVPVSSDLTAVWFATPSQGWAVGHDGVVLVSSDGGSSWARQLDGRAIAPLLAAEAASARVPAVAAQARLLAAQGTDQPLLDVWFEDSRTGFAAGAFGLLLRTEDGGRTWTSWLGRVDNPRWLHLHALRRVGADLWLVGEQGLLLRFDPAAGRFVAAAAPTTGSLFAVTGGASWVLACGLRGAVLRSADGGATWRRIESGVSSTLVAALAIGDGRVLLVSQDGKVLTSDDCGASFSEASPARGQAAAAAWGPAGLVVAGPEGVRIEPLGGRGEPAVTAGPEPLDALPVIRRPEDLDPASGGWLERAVFGHRWIVVALAVVITALLAQQATRAAVSADHRRLVPVGHPFIRNAQAWAEVLHGQGNDLQVAVEAAGGDVFDRDYLEALRQLTDELVLTPGVDRAWVRSLWMPGVRWTEVTEEGYRGGPVMPPDYDGSPHAIEALRANLARAGLAGTLVARDGRSSLILVPLLDRDPVTGAPIDYQALHRRVEALRQRFEGAGGHAAVTVHVVGFASLVGELLEGLRQVALWFAVAAAVVTAALYLYTRCPRSTALVVACSAIAQLWQLGLVAALGLPLDPFTVLVPFLVFALGVTHGAQKMNGIMQDIGRGTHRLVAARLTFRRLFLAGLAALLTDAVGFAVLWLIPVPAVRQLALTACLGTAVLIFTNLVLLPVLLSFTGVSRTAAARSLARDAAAPDRPGWRFLERLTEPRRARAVLLLSVAVAGLALWARRDLQFGDLEPGAPELRASSRYNRDVAWLAAHYGRSSDAFAVIVRSAPERCLDYRTLVEADRLAWALQQVPGVRATGSLADGVRQITAATLEGSPRWLTLSRNQAILDHAGQQLLTRDPGAFDAGCEASAVVAWLDDHRAATLDRVVEASERFAAGHDDGERTFLLAGGSAGIEAATNQVVRQARWPTALLVYGAVMLLCWLTLRSWRAVAAIGLTLALAGACCEALMAWLGIGVKVATLPVIALGVGIPDYALYLLSVQLAHQRAGAPLAVAHRRALRFTGRAVALAGFTLTAAVGTWAFSSLRLQSDMGLLLAFMFLANMAGALVVLPALSHLLLRTVPVRATPAPPVAP